VMPQAYIRTVPGTSGLKTSLTPDLELWICSMLGLVLI